MLSKFSVKKPYTVVVAIVIVLILGFVSYTKMPVDLIPSINLPYAVVSTTYIGATPEKVEQIVTSPIEQVLAAVNNVKNINSVSSENMSLVIIEFNEDTNMDTAIIELRENLDLVSSYFPDEIGNPTILKLNPNMLPIVALSVSVDGMSDQEAAVYIEDKVIPELKSVEGIASITATGVIENYVDIVISQEKIDLLNKKILANLANKAINELQETDGLGDVIGDGDNLSDNEGMEITDEVLEGNLGSLSENEKLSQIAKDLLGGNTDGQNLDINNETKILAPNNLISMISKDMIKGILSGQNFDMAVGSIEAKDGTTRLVRVGNKIESIYELKNLSIMSLPSYGEVRLSDVAEIKEYDNLGNMYSKINGNYGLMLMVQKQPNYSTAEVANNLHEKTEKMYISNNNLKFDILMDQGEYVDLMIGRIVSNLLLGALFAIIILIIFLQKIKPTIIVGASIFISVVGAFVMMYFSGITLNMLSMGGLALGVGMLVDNSIVVIDNIFRMRKEGKNIKEAAIEGAKEVSGAITASTITTVIVFLPIVFTKGLTRQLFTDMALTIGFSLLSSLVVALTLVPAASGAMLKNNMEIKDNFVDKISNFYVKILGKSLQHNWIVLLLAAGLFVLSAVLGLSSDVQLFPQMDSGNITVSIEMPDNYTTEERFEGLDKLNETLLDIDGVNTVGILDSSGNNGDSSFASFISGGTGGGISTYVLLDQNRTKSTEQIVDEIRTKTEKFEFKVKANNSNMDLSSLTAGQIAINVYGRELDSIMEASKLIEKELLNIDGIIDVNNGLGKPSTDMRIIVNKDNAIANGLSVAQVYMAVNKEISKDRPTGEITENGLDYKIYIKDDRDKNILAENIKDIKITSMAEQEIEINKIADIKDAAGFSSIRRENQTRTLSITASLGEGTNIRDINDKIEKNLKKLQLPDDCRYVISGEIESIKTTFWDLLLMLILAIVFIYLVMVAQFQSLLSPFIVMFTIPLAFTGSFLALLICNLPLSVVSIIGFIVLVGIVVNNAIVYVDYANQQMEKGMGKKEALLLTGKNRLKPILMTALTTIIALFAMVFDTNTGAEMLRPMAITTIGGMIYATLLTLFVIPSMYYIFKRKVRK